MTSLTLKFPANHPCGAGHFPGNPIIPGALLLDEVLTAIGAQLDSETVAWQVKSAKFPQPVRPGDTVLVNFTCSDNRDIRFDCSVSDKKVLTGTASNRSATESFLS